MKGEWGPKWKQCAKKDHEKCLLLLKGELYGIPAKEVLENPYAYDVSVFLAGDNLAPPRIWWHGQLGNAYDHVDVCWYIQDREPPTKSAMDVMVPHFMKWLEEGKKVSVSCIGGHGRTGTILAIINGLITKTKSPVEDVRKAICDKMVESRSQEEFIYTYLNLEVPKEKHDSYKSDGKYRSFARSYGPEDGLAY